MPEIYQVLRKGQLGKVRTKVPQGKLQLALNPGQVVRKKCPLSELA